MKPTNSKIESGFQLFTRVHPRPTLENLHPILFPNGNPSPNEIIQIIGAPSTGKTLLVTELIARCILPLYNNSGAVIINTDKHFNLLRLISIMEILLKGEKDVKSTIENSLKNLIILNCYSSEQLRLTFQNLHNILSDNIHINFLAIDSLVAYYWYDRLHGGAASINMYSVNLLNELKKVVGQKNIVTVFTKFENENAAKLVNNYVNHTIILQKNINCFNCIVYNREKETRFCKSYQIDKCFQFME